MLDTLLICILFLPWTVVAASIYNRAALNCSANAIPKPSVFGAEVTSLSATVINNFQSISGNNICFVNVTITHPGTGDSVNNWVALPLTGWNGIFQGVGGGGFAAGSLASLAAVSATGYSVSRSSSVSKSYC